MLKYVAIFAVIFGVTVFVSVENRRDAQRAAQPINASTSPSAHDDHPQENAKKSEPASPRWFGFFNWPEGITAWAIFLTLFAIAEQTKQTKKAAEAALISANAASAQIGEMRSQAGILRRQIELMKEQSDLMVGKERAKLRIELEPFRPTRSSDERDIYSVVGSVSIYGYTEAFIVRTQIYAWISVDGIFNPLPEWHFQITGVPSVVRAGTLPISFTTFVNAKDGPAMENEIVPVCEKRASIYCKAKIEFSDAFGQRWVLRLRRRFDFLWPSLAPDAIGEWKDTGPPEDNGEYRVEDERPHRQI